MPLERILSVLFTVCLALSCTSGGAGRDAAKPFVGPPTQVSWYIYRTNQTITLVNDAHTNRLELYSEVRKAAGPKVASDLDMDALVKYFVKHDFDDHAQSGQAPMTGGSVYSQALELNLDGRVSHMLLGNATKPEQRQSFNRCADALMTLWNLTFQIQAVENEDGQVIFLEQPGARIHLESR